MHYLNATESRVHTCLFSCPSLAACLSILVADIGFSDTLKYGVQPVAVYPTHTKIAPEHTFSTVLLPPVQ